MLLQAAFTKFGRPPELKSAHFGGEPNLGAGGRRFKSGLYDQVLDSNTPIFNGRAVMALANDPHVIDKTGQALGHRGRRERVRVLGHRRQTSNSTAMA